MMIFSGDQAVADTAEPVPPAATTKPKRRGFAAMDRSTLIAIAHKGGVSAHLRGTAHRFTAEEAREAGRKGGRAFHRTRGRAAPPKEQASTTPAPAAEESP